MSLATNLEYLMQLQNITPQELANHTQIDRSTLTRILNGSTAQPRLETIHILAKYFQVEPNSLLNNEYQDELKFGNTITKKNISDVLKWLMLKTGIVNISLLHKYTNVPISVLSDIINEKTEKPNVKTLSKLSNFFNLTIPQLMGTEKILSSQLIIVNSEKKTIPIVTFKNIHNWFTKQLGSDLEYITVNRPVLNENAFAVNIDSDIFEPDFSKYQVLVIDVQDPETGDFVVASINNQPSIFEYNKNGSSIRIRKSGDNKWIDKENVKFLLYGVVIQQIINRK